MIGAVAEAYYGAVPDAIRAEVRRLLTPDLLDVTEAFRRSYLQARLGGQPMPACPPFTSRHLASARLRTIAHRLLRTAWAVSASVPPAPRTS